ncbi:hypothetical protein CYY_006390 [Polysphondylium violaceum]|uniref:5'-nucleotidase n=1 Tax=Polysphondylium violaceum TaxID=133409 RepID=A0A8J4UZ04_9MYCE|nr:hypothetical protein CYY_006390 [Polysphondylium violaceum]
MTATRASTNEIVQIEIQRHKQLQNVDVIAFDMDMTLVRYNNPNVIQSVYNCMIDILQPKFPFLQNKPIDMSFCQRGLVIDITNGYVLKLDNQKRVVKAYFGNSIVPKETIDKVYHDDTQPLASFTGDMGTRFFSLVSFFESSSSLIFRDFSQHLIDESKKTGQPIDNNEFKKMIKVMLEAYNIHFSDFHKGLYYSEFEKNPGKFIYKAPKEVLSFLLDLKSRGVKTILATNSISEYTECVMNYSFGENYHQYFDLVIVQAQKPDFFHGDKPFYYLENHNVKATPDLITSKIQFNTTAMYKGGNVKCLLENLAPLLPKPEEPLSFCYVGDNLIGDVVAPKKINWLTIAIIEEIADPDEVIILKKRQQQKVLVNNGGNSDEENTPISTNTASSYEWGSFFHVHDDHSSLSIDSFWAHLIKNNADIVVPSVFTLAEYFYSDKFDHETLSPCAVVYGAL